MKILPKGRFNPILISICNCFHITDRKIPSINNFMRARINIRKFMSYQIIYRTSWCTRAVIIIKLAGKKTCTSVTRYFGITLLSSVADKTTEKRNASSVKSTLFLINSYRGGRARAKMAHAETRSAYKGIIRADHGWKPQSLHLTRKERRMWKRSGLACAAVDDGRDAHDSNVY